VHRAEHGGVVASPADPGQVLFALVDGPELALLAIGEDREGAEDGNAEGGIVGEIFPAIDKIAEILDETEGGRHGSARRLATLGPGLKFVSDACDLRE